MKLNPASRKASSSRNEVASSTVQPKTLPPKQRGETRRSDRPSRRISIACLLPVPLAHLGSALLGRAAPYVRRPARPIGRRHHRRPGQRRLLARSRARRQDAAVPLPLDLSTRAWVLTDGKAGDEEPCRGIAEALGLEPELRRVSPR